jgi:hypothetical protein
MRLAAEKEPKQTGESEGVSHHDHAMIHELSKRLDALGRYDQSITNAEEWIDLQNFWRDLKIQEQQNFRRLNELLTERGRKDCG